MEGDIISTIIGAISSVGLPAVMCGVLCWYINKLSGQHKSEMDKLSEAVQNNTMMMQKVLIHLEYMGAGAPKVKEDVNI